MKNGPCLFHGPSQLFHCFRKPAMMDLDFERGSIFVATYKLIKMDTYFCKDADKEIISLNDAVENFKIEKVGKSPSKFDEKKLNTDTEELNNICDECKEEDESVTQNLILTGFKLCKSCRVSKTIFPL